ncbi:MAG TPA: hypothetical protein DCP63_14895 [Bacteroidetes bacterium]|nr:hypothetical protein [Bacteroidota bacterium]
MTSEGLLRVFIVDDEDSFRLSIEMALKMTNSFVVRSCESGEKATEILRKESFDVILLDNRMGDMTGLEVLQWMQNEKIQTPVIMVTAAGSEAVAVEAMKLGVYDYLRKDQLDVERLSMAIKSVYERYLYRKQIIEREAEDRVLKEKQRELDSLQMYHTTVNSVGQLVEKSLAELAKNLKKFEDESVGLVKEEGLERSHAIFADLRQSLDVVSSGVASMRNLSNVVTHKLDEIKIAPKPNSR